MPPKPNGFMVFAMEWKSKYGLNTKNAVDKAGAVWKDMTPQERGPYNERAKNDKLQVKREKLTCTGTPLSIVNKEKREVEQQERNMKRFIENLVKNGVKNGDLVRQKFYFIMVNYFCKTIDGGIYVPAELSLCEFTLANGVCNKYHSFINPGVVIYGHLYETKQHSDSTHTLPLPPNAFGEKDLGKVYNDILHFIRPDDDSEYPPVYTEKENMPIVESVFKFLRSDEGANNVDIKVYSIQYLFFILKEGTCEIGEIPNAPSVYITNAYFEHDYFEFQTGIACDFHETADKSKYCTLSCVTRWAYMFADYMCNDVAITLVPGRHIPIETNFEAAKTLNTKDDTESFISMRTEATYATKALPGRGGYYDDQKSYVSDETIITASDFPKLEPVGKKRSKESKDSMRKIVLENAEDESEIINPWSTRSQKIPKQPDSSFFKVDCTTSDVHDDLSAIDDIQSVSSYGRGRGHRSNRSFTGGAGRGQNFR